MHLYLIRHAQSQNNALPESQRVEDPGITSLGMQQAAALAERLRGEKIDILLTSAFRRALETMHHLARARGQQPTIWTELHEKGGCYQGHVVGQLQGRPGMNRQEIESEFPGFVIPDDIDQRGWWRSRPYESTADAVHRARRQVDRLLQEFGDTELTVACVIHADLKELMVRSLADGPTTSCASADLHNTGVSHFHFEEHTSRALTFNDASHLPSKLRSK